MSSTAGVWSPRRSKVVETDIPARRHQLPWSSWHRLVVASLGIGGIIGPALYGHDIATGNRTTVFLGYLLGAILMILGGATEAWLGVDAEQKQLEDVAEPLTADS